MASTNPVAGSTGAKTLFDADGLWGVAGGTIDGPTWGGAMLSNSGTTPVAGLVSTFLVYTKYAASDTAASHTVKLQQTATTDVSVPYYPPPGHVIVKITCQEATADGKSGATPIQHIG